MSDSESKLECPACHEKTISKGAEIKPQVLDHYMSCLLTGQPFIKTYNLYDGRVAVRVKQVIDEDTDILGKVTTYIRTSSIPQQQQDMTIFNLYRYWPVVDITISYKGKTTVINTEQNIKKYCIQLLSSQDKDNAIPKFAAQIISHKVVSTLPSTVIERVLKTHKTLCDDLLVSGFDSTFFQGIQFA